MALRNASKSSTASASSLLTRATSSAHFKIYGTYFLLLAMACSVDRIFLGKFAALDIYDSVEVHFIHYKTIASFIRDFGLFGWYPNLAGGQPVFASQHPPYALPTLASAFFPIWFVSLAWSLCLQFLSGWGMYRMLREIIGLRDKLSLYLASIFAVCMSFGIVHLVYSFAFPMVTVWTLDVFDRSYSRIRRLFIVGGLLALMLTSFPVLTLPHFPIFHFALMLYFARSKPDYVQQVFNVVIVWTAYVLFFSPLIISLFQYIPYAQRSWNSVDVPFTTALIDFIVTLKGRFESISTAGILVVAIPYIIRCKQLRVPSLFVVVPLLLSAAFGSEIKHVFAETFFSKMDLFLSATVLSISSIIVVGLFLNYIIEKNDRIPLYFIIPALAIVSTFGAEHRVLLRLLIMASCPLALAALYNIAPWPWLTQKRALILLPVLLSFIVMLSRQNYATAGMFVPYAKGFDSHASLARLREEAKTSPFRVACVDIHPAIAQSYGLETVGLKFPLFNKYYKHYVGALLKPQFIKDDLDKFFGVWRQLYLTRLHQDHDQRPLALETGAEHSTAEYDLKMLRAMNVRYFVSSKPMIDAHKDLDFVTRDPGFDVGLAQFPSLQKFYSLPMYIYRLKESTERAFFATGVQIKESRQEVLNALASSGPVTTAVFAKEDIGTGQMPMASTGTGQLRIIQYAPDEIVLKGKTDAQGLVVVSNNIDPNWHAQANTVEIPIVRVNNAFQGITVPAGEFVLKLRYENRMVWMLHGLSLLGLALLMLPVIRGTKTVQGCLVPAQPPRLRHLAGEKALLMSAVQIISGPSIWAAGFYFFEYTSRRSTPNSTSYGYILLTTPVIGALLVIWAKAFYRRVANEPETLC